MKTMPVGAKGAGVEIRLSGVFLWAAILQVICSLTAITVLTSRVFSLQEQLKMLGGTL